MPSMAVVCLYGSIVVPSVSIAAVLDEDISMRDEEIPMSDEDDALSL